MVEGGIIKHRLNYGLPKAEICPQNLGSTERQLRLHGKTSGLSPNTVIHFFSRRRLDDYVSDHACGIHVSFGCFLHRGRSPTAFIVRKLTNLFPDDVTLRQSQGRSNHPRLNKRNASYHRTAVSEEANSVRARGSRQDDFPTASVRRRDQNHFQHPEQHHRTEWQGGIYRSLSHVERQAVRSCKG